MTLRVLMIDDAKAVHAYMRELCKAHPIQLSHCYDGKEGIEFLKTQSNSIDLVFLDWEMPVMTGIEALPEIKRQFPKIPVVMMTTKNSFEDIRKALELGADEYVMKPFNIEILIDKINLVGLRVA